jgi:hypothetical protein
MIAATSIQAPLTDKQPTLLDFTPIGRTKIQTTFDEPELSSDGGALLIREAAQVNGVIDKMVDSIRDERDQSYVKHTLKELLDQRVTQICLGYEDANDCDFLKDDVAVKMAADRLPDDDALASQPTMTRLENSLSKRDLLRLFNCFIDQFLDSYESDPECIILDVDPTANVTYGDQQLSLFNGFYDDYCLMPFHVYEGLTGRLISTVIRPGKTPTADEIIALLKRIVRRIRKQFPKTMLIFRADSHHTNPAVLDWLEENNVRYVLGLATNAILRREVEPMFEPMKEAQRRLMNKPRRFHSFSYGAGSWSCKRRVVARLEVSSQGTDARFIVTDLDGKASFLYDKVYCDRGNAELMIKEHKNFLKSSRTSCHRAEANQFRLFLHSAAYVIMHGLRDTALKGTELATATFDTIRLRLLKIAARVQVGKTFVRFHLSQDCPAAKVFKLVADRIAAVQIA